MNKIATYVTVGVLLSACSSAVPGKVGKACIAADRDAASSRLCSCIQSAANTTLSSSEQSRAASLLSDSEAVQAVKRSKSRANRNFWSKYNKFAQTAKRRCG